MKILYFSRKLNKRSGFSLAETLVTVLLLTIVLSAVTAGIDAARRAYAKIRMKSDAQMLLATSITELSTEFERARKLNGNESLPSNGSQISTYYSEYRGGMVTIENAGAEDDDGNGTVGIVLEDESKVKNTLVSDKTRGLDTLYTQLVGTDGKEGLPVFKNDTENSKSGYIEFTIQVCNHGSTGSDTVVAVQTVSVRPVLCQ